MQQIVWFHLIALCSLPPIGRGGLNYSQFHCFGPSGGQIGGVYRYSSNLQWNRRAFLRALHTWRPERVEKNIRIKTICSFGWGKKTRARTYGPDCYFIRASGLFRPSRILYEILFSPHVRDVSPVHGLSSVPITVDVCGGK